MSPHPLGVDFKMPLIVHNPSNHEFIISRNPSGWSDSISLQYKSPCVVLATRGMTLGGKSQCRNILPILKALTNFFSFSPIRLNKMENVWNGMAQLIRIGLI